MRIVSAALALLAVALPSSAAPPREAAVRTFSLGPLTLHVTSRPFRFSILEAGRPLLAERARRDAGSFESLGEDGWRRVADVLAFRARNAAPGGGPASRVLVEASLEGGGSVEVRFTWSAARGALEIAYATVKAGHLGVREDFVTLPDEALLVFGPALDGRSMRRRLVLSPRFALLAGGTGAAPGTAEPPRVFEPDPDALRIQAEGSTLLLELIPGAPRDALERIRGFEEEDPAADRPAATPLLWIDARSMPSPPDEERLRSLAAGASIGRAAGVLLEKDGAASFKLLSGAALARGPRPIVIDGWQALRAATASAIERAVLGVEPRVVQLPDEPGPRGAGEADLWARSIAAAALQPAVALHWDLVASCAAGGPIEPGERVERVRIARRLLRARAALEPVLGGASANRGGTGGGLIPLFVEHPEEEGAWKAQDEWLLGRDILVAPVLEEGAGSRAVYFPAGMWRDLRAPPDGAGGAFRGPGSHRVEIPEGEVGVFAREGGDAGRARALAEAFRGGPR